MTIENNAVQVQGIAFIDLEASSLGSASFPTEIGWAIIREDGSVESGSCLIRPPAKWTFYRNAWSAVSERLTGIAREILDQDGLPPSEALICGSLQSDMWAKSRVPRTSITASISPSCPAVCISGSRHIWSAGPAMLAHVNDVR